MAEWRQKLRGTTTELDQVTGLIGMVAYDTQRKELRVFDGVLLGGYRIPNLPTIDTAYKLPDRLTVNGVNLEGASKSANEATDNGYYYTDAATTDCPEGAAATIHVTTLNEDATVVQVWTRGSNANQYKRTYNASVWSAWERIADLEYINNDTNINAYNSARLGSQLPAYYTDIVARLGYTPVNKAGDTITGPLTIQSASTQLVLESTVPRIYFKDTTAGSDDFWVHVDSDSFFVLTDRADDGSYEAPYPLELRNDDSQAYVYGNKVYHTGNDGAGSGLDSDLLDGQEGSYYTNITARLGYTPVNKAGDTMTGNLIISNSAPILNLKDTTTSAYDMRLRLDANNIYFDSSSDGSTYAEFVRFEADTKLAYFQNTLTVTTTSGEGLRIDTSSATQDPYISWYQAGTRKGYIQYLDGTGNNLGLKLHNDVATGGDTMFTLLNSGGINGLEYTVNGTEYTVLHTGNRDNQAIAQFSTTSSAATTSFPLGHSVLALVSTHPDRNASQTPALYTLDNRQYVTSAHANAGASLTGTWRARGVTGGDDRYLFQRVG